MAGKFLNRHKSLALGTSKDKLNGCRVNGHVSFPLSNHSTIALRSKFLPHRDINGSLYISKVKGQMNDSGMSILNSSSVQSLLSLLVASSERTSLISTLTR